MDANQTRFHLLLGKDDWSRCTDDSGRKLAEQWMGSPPTSEPLLAWDELEHELLLQPRLFEFPPPPSPTSSPLEGIRGVREPRIEDRRAAAQDRFGNWYWIGDSKQRILVRSVGSNRTSTFWPPATTPAREPENGGEFKTSPPPRPCPSLRLAGLTITKDHYLAVGVIDPKGFLYFDLHAGGCPVLRRWPADVSFEPFDFAPRPGGGFFALDRRHRALWEIDRHFEVVAAPSASPSSPEAEWDAFAPRGELRPSQPAWPRRIQSADALPVEAADPIAVEALPDCSVLILDRDGGDGFAAVVRYRDGVRRGSASACGILDLIEATRRAEFRLVGHDFAVLLGQGQPDDPPAPSVYIVSATGNQVFAFDLHYDQASTTLEPVHVLTGAAAGPLREVHAYFPLRLFGGKGLVAHGEQIYYDFGQSWVPLVAQHRPRFIHEARLFTPLERFDSEQPDCTWHRLMLDACLPAETSLEVFTRAHNDRAQLELLPWQKEPKPHRRATGSELPWWPASKQRDVVTWELLFQRATGRYLQLQLRLIGNGRATPRLRALRAYAPRFSYLKNYLPAVYWDDTPSASFLERFLANPEGQLTALEDKIATVQLLLDPKTAPAEALEWLASWFGIALDPRWDEQRRRLFLQHTLEFFQYRGTIRGLVMALRLAFDAAPDHSIFTDDPRHSRRARRYRVVERFRTRRAPAILFGDPSEAGGRRATGTAARWLPHHGGAELNRRYQEALKNQETLKTTDPTAVYPLLRPNQQAQVWEQFSRDALGFVPIASGAAVARWRDFLARRYRTISALREAWRSASTAIEQINLPTALPADGPALEDWYHFQALVWPMNGAAHRFSVLLPVTAAQAQGSESLREQVALADRVIRLQKPAHTLHDIRFFWNYFRLGEARLGEDTLLGPGSRAPDLLPSLVLGEGHLAQSYLAGGHPWNVEDRFVLGRNRVRSCTSHRKQAP
jgi:phage tail-like protein